MPHFLRSQRSARWKLISFAPQILTSAATARSRLSRSAGRAARGENDDRREIALEDFGVGVDGAGAADNDAQVEFRQTAPQAQAAVFGGAGSQGDGVRIHGARAGHHGIGSGAQLEQMLLVTPASEGGNEPIGCGDLPVRRHRHVDQDEGQGS